MPLTYPVSLQGLGAEWLGAPVSLWLIFAALLAALLIFDLGVLNKQDREIGFRASLIHSSFYIGLGLGFGAFVWWRLGSQAGLAYLTGFAVEKTLSLDNIFVIAMILLSFGVPRAYQHRVLFWGIIFAIVLRAILIGLGGILVAEFNWTLYVFSAFLIAMGGRILAFPGEEKPLSESPLLRFLRGHFNITDEIHGHNFLVRLRNPKTGKPEIFATPLMMALVMVEFSDVIFAIDSVPAIYAITSEPFIVYTSNIFAIMGLRALFFTLSSAIDRFRYLKPALAAVLIFIGSKIFIADLTGEEIPAWLSLGTIVGIITTAGLLSFWRARRGAAAAALPAASGALTLAVLAGGLWSLQQETVSYVTQPAGRGPVERIVTVTGTVDPASVAAVKVKAALPGRVEALPCSPGAAVKAGEICAIVGRDHYLALVDLERSRLAAAEARLKKAKIRLDRAKARSERMEAKARRQAAPSTALKKAQIAYKRAQARINRAEARAAGRRRALVAAQARLAATEIASPIDGTVLCRNVQAGQAIPAGAVLFEIAPPLALVEAQANLSAQDKSELNEGDKAMLRFKALPGRFFEGEVGEIRSEDRSPGAGEVIAVKVPNAGSLIEPGMQAFVQITVERRDDVLRVPNQALQYAGKQGGGEAGAGPAGPGWVRLWVLRGGEPAPERTKLGLEGRGYTEVVSGELRPGDHLILGEGASTG